ncbi:MAG: DUF4294 domain-containing protein [Bacteroidaceae bacterium]|nr:DUF4294 domain-containing protein [Bacteroidaceae bacterium]
MKLLQIFILSCLPTLSVVAQPVMDSVEEAYMHTGGRIFSHRLYLAGIVEFEGEEVPWYQIAPVYIFPKLIFANEAEARRYYQIANNIKKVYPIAVDIARDVRLHTEHLDSLEEKRDRDQYMKKMEKELKQKYTPRCKKLTLTQGKLLIKLVDRQCEQTAFRLVRSYMGSFKATFYNTFASIFGASLKKEYDPEVDDRITERCILLIESGQM